MVWFGLVGLWCLTIFQLYLGSQFLLVEETGGPRENHRSVPSHLTNICGFTVHCKQKSNMNSIFRYLRFNRSSTGIVVVGLLSTYLVFIFNTYIRGSHGRDRIKKIKNHDKAANIVHLNGIESDRVSSLEKTMVLSPEVCIFIDGLVWFGWFMVFNNISVIPWQSIFRSASFLNIV
jgi:hypothetical protein